MQACSSMQHSGQHLHCKLRCRGKWGCGGTCKADWQPQPAIVDAHGRPQGADSHDVVASCSRCAAGLWPASKAAHLRGNELPGRGVSRAAAQQTGIDVVPAITRRSQAHPGLIVRQHISIAVALLVLLGFCDASGSAWLGVLSLELIKDDLHTSHRCRDHPHAREGPQQATGKKGQAGRPTYLAELIPLTPGEVVKSLERAAAAQAMTEQKQQCRVAGTSRV